MSRLIDVCIRMHYLHIDTRIYMYIIWLANFIGNENGILRKPICDIVFCIMTFLTFVFLFKIMSFESCFVCFVYNSVHFRWCIARGWTRWRRKRERRM